MKITTDLSRGVRPVFIVEKGNLIRITNTLLDSIKSNDTNINRNHLIGGFRNTSEKVPFNYTDSSFHSDVVDSLNAQGIKDLISKLKETSGIIEYIDSEESNSSLVALNHVDLTSKRDHYEYCEIHPSLILGVLANAVPALSMNQAPRNQFSTSHAKQALGIYATNYRNRMDNKGQILHYTQRPLIKSKLSKYINFENLPHGINALVAIGCFSGYNQEDSIIFNLDSVKRGLFRSTKFLEHIQQEMKLNLILQKKLYVNPNQIVFLI